MLRLFAFFRILVIKIHNVFILFAEWVSAMTDLIHFVRFLYTYKHLRDDGGGGGLVGRGGSRGHAFLSLVLSSTIRLQAFLNF